MKLPYGIANFKSIREEGYLYIDKTGYIAKLENLGGRYLFFIRPRRFGKSLFLSTLEHYYDLNMENEFDHLFGDLYIGRNPTGLKNSYLILKFNFSGLNTENRMELVKSFRLSVTNAIISFLDKYEEIFGNDPALRNEIKSVLDLRAIIDLLVGAVQKTGKKIYLFIDEYDHFANDVIAMGDGEFYREIVRATGFVRDFYETLKIGTESVIDRIFITGISPVMLDDLTSGFNIASNITLEEDMNTMLGFTENELQGILNRLNIKNIKEKNLHLKLKEYYNGYLFNIESQERVYNPDMILYYLDRLQRTGKQPAQLIDDNVKTDYGRLNRLVYNENNKKALEEIIREEVIESAIVTKFSFDRMYDEEYFVSLLFYMGLLTIKDRKYGSTELVIPNYVIRTVFWDYFKIALKKEYKVEYRMGELNEAIWKIAFEGKLEPFLSFISDNVLKALSNRDTIQFNEKYLKLILFAYLITTGLYRPISEREVENGYIDLFLERDIRVPDVKFEWLLELKYLKVADQKKIEQTLEEGLRQLKEYGESRNFAGKKDIKQALVIFIGKDRYLVTEIYSDN